MLKKPYSDAMVRQWIDGYIRYCIDYIPSYISPNHITLLGFIIGLFGIVSVAYGYYWAGLLFLLCNRIGDALDGIYAYTMNKQQDSGAFLDIILDFIIYSAFPLAFIFQNTQLYGLVGALLIFSFMVCGGSFLAFAIFAQKHAIQSHIYDKKGIYYMQGIVEGTETCIFMLLSLLFPHYFNYIGSVFATLCFITGGSRIWYGYIILQRMYRHENQ